VKARDLRWGTLLGKVSRRSLRASAQGSNRWGGHFATVRERPKSAGQVGTWAEREVRAEPVTIVMQGPVVTENDFTLETLRLYGKHAPECRRILSTWKETPRPVLEAIAAEGVELVLSDKPANPGLYNVNLQLVGAASGVRAAVAGGAEWILKTRTDQRLYGESTLGFLVGLAKTFPVRGSYDQRYRVIGLGQGSLKYAPYHLTDQTVFGHAEDLLKYWTPPLREAPLPSHWPASQQEFTFRVPIGELCRSGAAECYFASQFLTRIGRPLAWTLEDSWAAYRDHFCVVDYATSDFYWVKGQTISLTDMTAEYGRVSTRKDLGFRDWLLLYTGQLPCEAARRYEHVLETFFRETVVPVEHGLADVPLELEAAALP
jgi:WavE lipopolysaccharide synthesis